MVHVFFFSSRRRHTRWTGDWSSDVCSSDLGERQASLAIHDNAGGGAQTVGLTGTGILPANGSGGRGTLPTGAELFIAGRSEERRVGKECRSRWAPDH